MAIVKNPMSKNLVVNAEAGIAANGSVKIKAYNFSGVNQEATDENVYAVGVALGGLIQGDTDSIYVVEKAELLQD